MIKLAEPEGFRPFVVVTASGSRWPVPHADFIDIPPLGDDEDEEGSEYSFVLIYRTKGPAVPVLVDLLNITEVELVPQRA